MVGPAAAAIALLLLGTSGVAKVMDPMPTSGALRAARLPSAPVLARLLGVAEIGAAVVGLALGAATLIPAAILYAAFAVFTWAAVRRRIPIQSCGCFSREDTPPSLIHVVYNFAAAIALGWVAASGSSPLPWESGTLELVLYTVFAGTGAYASYLLLARLPQVLTAR